MASIHFLGAAGTVTGSKYLLEHDGRRILVDCGLFQGARELRSRNWEPLPVPAKTIDCIVLTHAHIDHTGGLPRVVRDGFNGPVYATSGTRDLCALLLPDSAHLQEEEARYANKKGSSKHTPALPLYSPTDAAAALRLVETFGYDRPREILPGITLRFERAGHILGSAICVVDLAKTHQQVVFSGDLGRYDAPVLRDPEPVATATTLLAEATYGDKLHGEQHPMEQLAAAVKAAADKRGALVIPAFAVGRTQEILYRLRELETQQKVPILDVYVDSPMACDATPIYLAHPEEHDLEMSRLLAAGESPLSSHRTRFVTSVQESKRLNQVEGPCLIISASGMATGGRILHHLAQRLPDPKNVILFVGYQSPGTRGHSLLSGAREIKIFGELVPARAEIRNISGFSAHADWKEMMRWMDGFVRPPKQTLLIHGEPSGLEALRGRVAGRGWPVQVPRYLEKVELV
jgi:metallo-beta-lactamase family protein